MSGLNSPADDADRRFSLDRNHRSPLWRQIASALEREILRVRFVPGDRLPAESTLAKWYSVNRLMARDAVRMDLCDVLTSDYFYPSLLQAAFALAREKVCPFPRRGGWSPPVRPRPWAWTTGA
jgi:hypothetical protein